MSAVLLKTGYRRIVPFAASHYPGARADLIRNVVRQETHPSLTRKLSNSKAFKMPFAKVEGKQLHYTDYPPASDVAPLLSIIFVHGLGSTQNFYQPVLPYLTKYRCITFDNYGAGRSKFYPELYPDTTVESIGRDVLALLDHLKVDKAVVVGFSMGGMLPSYLAADSKGSSRVIAGICIGPVNPSPAAADLFEKRIETVTKGGMETMANSIPSAATGPGTTTLQKALIREMLLAQEPEGYIANCRAIANASPPAYEKVRCPMLIIAGEVDKSAPVSGCQFIFDHLGTEQKKMEVLNGIGHWLCVEDGDRVGKLIAGFVAGVRT